VSDRQELYRSWLGWVTTNVGRDPKLAEIAASAAADAAEQGRGFNSAADAARTAWADATTPRTTTVAPQERGATSVSMAQRPALGVIVGVLVISGVLLGPSGLDGSGSFAKAAWLGSAITAVIWLALRPVASVRSVKPAVWLSLTLILAALLCWPAAGWIMNGLDQIGVFQHSQPTDSMNLALSMPVVASALGCIGSIVGVIARQHAAVATGRRLASVTSLAGAMLPIVAMVSGVVWFIASLYGCYAAMC
jgi:hypothetical protein